MKLIDDSKYGKFDVVVSYALDRISREEHGGFYGYENTLNKNGVRIEYATQVFDDGYGGEISKAVHVTMAAEYVAQLRKNVVRGMRDNVMKGNYNGGGRLPIGIRIVDDGKGNKRYAPDEAVAPLIEQAFKLYVMGKSSKEIADFLNHNGVRNCYGNKISVNTVNRMIGNPIYKGTKITTFDNKVEHKIYTVEGVCEPIVSEDLWENAQLAHEKREYRGARSDARVEYILHSKLYCGICDTVMIANSGKSKNGDMYYYYACRDNKMKKGKEKCPKKNVSKTVIENAVMKIISDWVRDEERIAAITAACKKAESERVTDPRAAQLEASIRKHRERKQRASEMFLDSGDKIWAEHVKEETLLIEADEKELSAIRKHETNPKTTEEFIAEIKNLRKCWDMMQSTDAGRKKIVSNFIERIVVFDAYPDDPGRMKIELTIRTNPLGTYTEEITANIQIGVSGNERMVEAAGFEPASERPSSQLSTSVVPCLLSLCPAGRNTLRSKPAPLLWRVTEPCARSRSLLHDATHRAAVLPGMTAAAIKQRLKLSYYCQLLFKSGAFIEAPRLCSLIMPRIPRRNPFAPI